MDNTIKKKHIGAAIDCQYDFIDEKGKLSVKNAHTLADRIVELSKCDDFDFYIATLDWHHPEDAEFIENGGPFPHHCMADSLGASLINNMSTPKYAYIKNQYDIGMQPKFAEKFIKMIKEENVGEITVWGVATDFCVKAAVETFIRLSEENDLDLQINVVKDAIMGIDPVNSDNAFNDVTYKKFQIK